MNSKQQTITFLESEQLTIKQTATLFKSIAQAIEDDQTATAANLADLGLEKLEDAAALNAERLDRVEADMHKPAQMIDIDRSKLGALKMALAYTRKAADYKDLELSPSDSTPFYSALDALDSLADQCEQRQDTATYSVLTDGELVKFKDDSGAPIINAFPYEFAQKEAARLSAKRDGITVKKTGYLEKL